MKTNNHYERAFRHLLQQKSITHVAVNESHRSAFAQVHLKSFDFIAYLPDQNNLIVDVKGRKARRGKRDWLFDPWVTEQDVEAMGKWQEIFGKRFSAAFIFAFWLGDFDKVELFESVRYEDRFYRFYAIYLDDYKRYLKPRSSRWQSVTIPRAVFRELAWEID